jgi:hypothetical protein
MPCDLQEEERFIYEPWFRVADWMEVFRDLIPAAQSEPGVASSTMGPDPFRTGAAGRRPAYHLIQEELERRIRTKEVKPKLRGHAAACRRLEDWWKIERKTFNPHGPPMTARSIENSTRDIWRAALNANPIK